MYVHFNRGIKQLLHWYFSVQHTFVFSCNMLSFIIRIIWTLLLAPHILYFNMFQTDIFNICFTFRSYIESVGSKDRSCYFVFYFQVAIPFRSYNCIAVSLYMRQVPLTIAVTTTARRDFNFASTQYNAGRIAGVAENNRDYPRRTRPSSPMTITITPGSRRTTKYNLIIWSARTRFPTLCAAPRNAQLRSTCAATRIWRTLAASSLWQRVHLWSCGYLSFSLSVCLYLFSASRSITRDA